MLDRDARNLSDLEVTACSQQSTDSNSTEPQGESTHWTISSALPVSLLISESPDASALQCHRDTKNDCVWQRRFPDCAIQICGMPRRSCIKRSTTLILPRASEAEEEAGWPMYIGSIRKSRTRDRHVQLLSISAMISGKDFCITLLISVYPSESSPDSLLSTLTLTKYCRDADIAADNPRR